MKTYALAVLMFLGWSILDAAAPAKPLPEDIAALRALAEKGDARACFELGLRHARGDGVKKDVALGYAWLAKAELFGHKPARKQMDILAQGMTRDGITQAFRIIRQMADQMRNLEKPNLDEKLMRALPDYTPAPIAPAPLALTGNTGSYFSTQIRRQPAPRELNPFEKLLSPKERQGARLGTSLDLLYYGNTPEFYQMYPRLTPSWLRPRK